MRYENYLLNENICTGHLINDDRSSELAPLFIAESFLQALHVNWIMLVITMMIGMLLMNLPFLEMIYLFWQHYAIPYTFLIELPTNIDDMGSHDILRIQRNYIAR